MPQNVILKVKMPFQGPDFYMDWTDLIQDQHGKEQKRRKHGQNHFKVDGTAGIPGKLVRDLMTIFPLEISTTLVLKSFKNS